MATLLGVAGQERRADGVRALGGQLEARLGGHLAQEGIGDLRHDARAVAAVHLGADRSPVVEVAQRGEPGLDDVVARPAPQRRDERHSAGVALLGGVVQAMGSRQGTERVGMQIRVTV